LGYNDGLPRSLDAKAAVLVRGRRAPIIGRISMDITIVDVTDVTAAAAGDTVVMFGGESTGHDEGPGRDTTYSATLEAAIDAVEGVTGGERPVAAAAPAGAPPAAPTVEEMAAWAGTIPHEILCRVGPRVPRRYSDPAAVAGGRR
jgi:alanine racemase